jgi:LysM repeat protein
MRLRILPCLAALTLLVFPAAANAAFEHLVAPGESLSSVAAADGLSVAQIAAANGVSTDTQLIAGTLLSIPAQTSSPVTQTSSSITQTSSSITPSTPSTTTFTGDGDGDADDSSTAAAPSGVSSGAGSYVVQPGDTLSAIAARAGISVDSLAAANGISASGTLLAGSVLSLSGAASTVTMVSQPISTASATTGGPYPTPQTVSASDIGSIATANGVSPSLAAAVGWQESGFNNDLVSGTGAVGVMQIEPGTWSWIGQNLTGSAPLSPYSATDNVRGGVLLLHSLLSATGGDPALAAAGYYQGLQSIQQHGMYSDTQQYVNNVLALRSQFGGP